MARWIRRIVLLAILAGAGFAARSVLRPRATGAVATGPAPPWPPFEPPTPVPAVPIPIPAETNPAETNPAEHVVATAGLPDWLPGSEGDVPAGYPIKANDNSHIYHLPGGRFYDRTRAERFYATAAAAERDGYRRAKS